MTSAIRLSQTAVRHFIAIVDPTMAETEARELLREEVDEAEPLPEAFSGDAFWSLKGTGLRAIVRETADGPLAVAVVRARPRVYAVHKEIEPFVPQPDRPSIKERRALRVAAEMQAAQDRKAAEKEARRIAHEKHEETRRRLLAERDALRETRPKETPLSALLDAQDPRNLVAEMHYHKLVMIARRVVRLGDRRPEDDDVVAISELARLELPAADLANMDSTRALKKTRKAIRRVEKCADLEARLAEALIRIAELENST